MSKKISKISKKTPEILYALRESHQLTQVDLAKLLGVVQQTYSNYEKGHTAVPVEYLLQLAEFYNVSTDYLLGRISFQQPLPEVNNIFAQKQTLGQIITLLLTLIPERRSMLVDYLYYLLEKQKENIEKQKL